MLGSDGGSGPTEEDRTLASEGRMFVETSKYGGLQVEGSKDKKLFS